MIKRIHIVGASGSGTSTLGINLQDELGYKHLDTDDYFWETKYSKIREIPERITLIQNEIEKYNKWVLSGSLCGWGDLFIPYFDLIIFIYIPKEIRMERLKNREYERYGDLILEGNQKHGDYLEFISWAGLYDDGDESVRSKKLHLDWLGAINSKIIKIEGLKTISEEIEIVKNEIENEES